MQEMNMLQKQYPDLTVQKDVLLSGYTTLRVGGKADYLLTAETEETICGVLRFLQEKGIPYLLMGNGSNLLVKDGGFRGVVVRFGKEFGTITKTDDGLYAQSGALMSLLSKAALDYPLSLVTVENPANKNGKHLVVFRDSFGSSVAPLLAQGYEKVTLVDIRYIGIDYVSTLVDYQNADVLFLYSTSVLNNSNTIK